MEGNKNAISVHLSNHIALIERLIVIRKRVILLVPLIYNVEINNSKNQSNQIAPSTRISIKKHDLRVAAKGRHIGMRHVVEESIIPLKYQRKLNLGYSYS